MREMEPGTSEPATIRWKGDARGPTVSKYDTTGLRSRSDRPVKQTEFGGPRRDWAGWVRWRRRSLSGMR